MMTLKKCQKCNEYTMKDAHCDEKTINPSPPRYSPEDRYGKYRRMAKEKL